MCEYHSVNHHLFNLMIRLLEDRFYSGFRQWFWRARTILGRLLVAQVVIYHDYGILQVN